MTKKEKRDINIEWIKEPLELEGGNWKDNWKSFRQEIKKTIEKTFGKNAGGEKLSQIILDEEVEWRLNNLEESIKEKVWKKQLTRTEMERVHRLQNNLYNIFVKELNKEKEENSYWKNISEKRKKIEGNDLEKNFLSFHRRHASNLSLEITSEDDQDLKKYFGENLNIVLMSPLDNKQETNGGETSSQADDEKELDRKLPNDSLENWIRPENKIRELEKEILKLKLEKRVREIDDEISECKKSIKDNFELYQELMEKRISENNDSHGKHYLEENQNLELKVAELKKQKTESENQLAFLQKEETVAKIEIFPKK